MDVTNDNLQAANSVQVPNKLPRPWDYWNRCTEAGAPTIGRAGSQLLCAWRTVELQASRIGKPGSDVDRWCDTYLFAVAVQKLRRLATKTGEKLGSKRMATAVQVFNTASQGSEAVRHMLEHEEDYLFGDGHLQRSGTPGYSWTFNAHRENVEAPARHTISVLEGQYKLIVEETAVLAETLIQEAIAALEELRSTSPS